MKFDTSSNSRPKRWKSVGDQVNNEQYHDMFEVFQSQDITVGNIPALTLAKVIIIFIMIEIY